MENTSYIAQISYIIENWLFEGYNSDYIKKEINKLKNNGEFPANLEYVDAYFDKNFSSSGCAFLDTNTGETIVGFAGTNNDNGILESTKDIITDGVGLGITGVHEDSPYMKKANKFIDNLQEKGYNITQSTGHSLGGALCTYIGINHDIPFITTYNGAPLYVLPTAELTGNASAIKNKLKEYDGKVVRFVSDKDWLNGISDFASGFYVGEEYMIHNGRPHDMDFFIDSTEQKYISEILQSKSRSFNNNMPSSIDFDGDGNIDLLLTPENIIIKNLFGKGGLYSGNGVTISINPDAFYNLRDNLQNNMVGEDISWINTAIKLCIDKNDSIKNDRSQREDMLCNKIVDGLNEASLTKLISGINDSHGELIKNSNKNILKELSEFNTYSVTRKFDMWGSSSGRRWFLDGVEFDEYDLIDWVKELKYCASTLYHEITTTGEFTYYSPNYATPQVYKFDTISDISKAFINVTNSFLGKAEKTFKGTGLRSGKNDGIVNSISEVLEVEEKNIEELRMQILNIAEMAGGLGDNFSSMDKWLSEDISRGKVIGKYELSKLPSNYNAYLEEHHIFDDVIDVIEAYDLQVECAASTLSNSIVSDFDELLSRAYKRLKTIFSAVESFKNSVNKLESRMSKYVTSIYTKTTMIGYNEWETEEINYSHGTLSDSFPGNIISCIAHSKRYILPLLDSFHDAIFFIGLYNSQMYNLKEYFSMIVEEVVYDSMELNSIIEAQNLISARIERMMEEIKKVNGSIEVQYKGKSLKNYQIQLESIVKSLNYFNMMINDCFGKNSNA